MLFIEKEINNSKDMDREIKFRAKCNDNGKWVYGSYIQSYNSDNDWIVQDGDFFAVDSDTVGQFTGFHDKDGKEIYEGDILCDVPLNVKYFIFYSNLKLALCFANLEDMDENSKTYNILFRVNKHGKVLGNKYNNPELLKNN